MLHLLLRTTCAAGEMPADARGCNALQCALGFDLWRLATERSAPFALTAPHRAISNPCWPGETA